MEIVVVVVVVEVVVVVVVVVVVSVVRYDMASSIACSSEGYSVQVVTCIGRCSHLRPDGGGSHL